MVTARKILLFLATAQVLLGCGREVRPASAVSGTQLRLLVGTYTEGTSAQGVYLYSYDPATAQTQLLSVAPSGNPSFVIPSPDGSRAWSVNEFNDGRQGASAYSLGDTIAQTEHLLLPKDVLDGEDPCHLLYVAAPKGSLNSTPDAFPSAGATPTLTPGVTPALTPNLAGTLISANYTGGTLAAWSVGADGSLDSLAAVFKDPLEGPPAHMHCSVLSPDGKYIYATDLGRDRIYRFSACAPPLSDGMVAWQGPQGFGPRHLTFSADGRFAYLICELGDKLVVFSYADGAQKPIQTLTAYRGRGHGSADIHLSPDGRFLYTSHRLRKDGIAIFKVDPWTGKLKRAGFRRTGTHPRNFAISPDGRYLLCACRDDDRIEIYARDPLTGALTLTDRCINVGAPVCVQFLTGR